MYIRSNRKNAQFRFSPHCQVPRKICPEASHGALELEAATRVQSTEEDNELTFATWQAKGLEGLHECRKFIKTEYSLATLW